MSDITLHSPRNLPASAEDLWGQPQNGNALGAYQPQNAPQPAPLKKLNRLLRGRWLLAITLSLAGALGGAMVGWKSQLPLYAGETAIEIKPIIPNINVADKAQPYFQQSLKNEALRIPTDRIISESLKRPEWLAAHGYKYTKDNVAVFQNNLTVNLVKDSSMIQIIFQSEDPKKAAAGANAVMKAYVAIRQDDGGDVNSAKMREAQRNLDDAKRMKQDLEDQIANLTKDYGAADLGPAVSHMMEEREKLQFDLNMQELALKNAQAAIPDAKGTKKAAPLAPEDLAQFDPQMRSLLDQQQKAKDLCARAQEFWGPKNPQVAKATMDYDLAVKAVNDYAAQATKRAFDIGPGLNTNNANSLELVTPKTIEIRQQYVANYNDELTKLNDRLAAIGKVNQQVTQLAQQEKRSDEKINNLTDAINSLVTAGALGGTIVPQGDAIETNKPAVDKRPQVALMGLMAGGALPFGLMLLIGLLDSRYRYSDDTSDAGVNGLTLLGILPNLPDRLSDPGQASIAAHCVHQIRTMLQISNFNDKRAYSVTSASSGDGKTSLTLALGLSFAASGSRTLLIDSDLVGAGLTARLGMNGPEGILEAMTSGQLMEYVKQTDVSDLSILPVGLAQLHHAGIFSPQSVRKLVNEAKKHFEIILIDTGPILGSIEATPVAAASDGVILTVARGQQRPLVEKALAHLNSIGARVAGVVFNRAQSRDFEQSISGISMRSASRSSNGNGQSVSRAGQQKDAGQYGPVARAVAGSTKNAETNKN
jgi:capsular exopolysaccharide synthesis family protein